jgi:hypothetical protein
MDMLVSKYCKTCDLCLQTKAQKQPLMGELKTLPIAEGHWDVASVDFIVDFPESQGHDAIMVVVDLVGKYWKSVIEIVLFRGLQGRVYLYYCRVTRMYYNYLQKAGTTACQASAHQSGIPELPYPVGSPTLPHNSEVMPSHVVKF